VDDDLDDQEIFSLALMDVGLPVTCITASDCAEAINLLREENDFVPDYIFLDVNMPKMNGMECLREIKKLAHVRNIPVVMYSTTLKQSDIIETRRLGATGFITKPSNIRDLTRLLNDFFQRTSVHQTR
jgi:CheY-like chemotaxis protein